MATSAGAVEGEFQAIFIRGFGPVVCFGVDEKIMRDVAGAGGGFDGEKFKKIAVGQVAVHALGGESLGIIASVDGIFPSRLKRRHDVACDAECVGVCGFNHETGRQNGDQG